MPYSPASITPRQFLQSWGTVAAAFGNFARERGNVTIPSCGSWTSADLIAHLGHVFAMVDDVIVHQAQEPRRLETQAPTGLGSFDDLLDWFEERRQALWLTMSTADPELAVWTWGPPSTVTFYLRRMTHETTVHLHDLYPDLDFATLNIDRAIYCDGIDEYFHVVLPRSISRSQSDTPLGSLHLHCTDGEGEWLVSVNDRTVDMSHEHAKASVAWRGSAADLLLSCWGRNRSAVEVLGDTDVSRQWATIAP